MRGFVPTPPQVVDAMVMALFRDQPPTAYDRLLDPGSGTGAFIDGVLRWGRRTGSPIPRITAVESDPRHVEVLRRTYSGNPSIDIQARDFLLSACDQYQYIIGNPPYVSITGLSEDEKAQYRALFQTARGRFDLYVLFFEKALSSLALGGRLAFITPEKFAYVESAAALRRILASSHVEQIQLMPEDTFGSLVTYPTVTLVRNDSPAQTRVLHRDGTLSTVQLPRDGRSWLSTISGGAEQQDGVRLGDVCRRISCGVATGADKVFIFPADALDPALLPYARPTVAGRELTPGSTQVPRRNVMVMPYDPNGHLMPFDELGALGEYLSRDEIRKVLLARTCTASKPWYAFHETPVLEDMLAPKILFKDIGPAPQFWVDWTGDIVPRHSVYYLVPRHPESLPVLLEYLSSKQALQWLQENCQRAAKGYMRLQSRVLKRMPLPDEIVDSLNRAPAPARRKPSPRMNRVPLEKVAS